MSAPVATLPAAANDSRPARPVCFTSRASAVAHASRLARLASASGTYHATQYLTDTFRPVEGGDAYAVRLGVLDWEVVTVSEAEVTRCQQAWLRRSIESHHEVARAHDLAAGIAKPGSSWQRQHLLNAQRERDYARALELRLTVSVVVPASCSCGKPVVVNGRCRGCDEDRFYRRDTPGAQLEGAE